ncbi:unnamed protein product, partial [Mesorhabditis belari]|uniref:Major facilitator superfamily (MFS) profile domain-containing protein n=1 Tax=Mesorhabditis belari TaxID=2138241 RepID=A0AAF3ERY1_9BILA
MMEENSSECSSLKDSSEKSPKCIDNTLKDFSKYQIVLLVLTQLGYLPIAACLLVTSIFSPPAGYCGKNGTINAEIELDFHSLLLEWDLACKQPNVKSIVSTAIMLGGLAGAFLTGYIADTYGRRPAILGTLLCISFGCLVVSLVGELNWIFTTAILGVLGAACGGYMVVNLTLVVEFLCTSRSRLLVVCVNGWPLSMAMTAGLAYFSAHWRPYFLTTACIASLVFISLYIWSMESVRWLASKNRVRDAVNVAQKVIKKNGAADGAEFLLQAASRGKTRESEHTKNYLYLDLLKFRSIRKPLLALTYCFVSSSIVSFGYYLFIDTIPGNRLTNFAVMGLLKFFCGLIPFLLSFVGRRPLVLLSLGVACTASYSILAIYFLGLPPTSWLYGVLSVIAAASIDPAWKVNHLYSAELFPTAVRTMARAVCNIGGRLGSVAAPWVVSLDSFSFIAPYSAFTVFLSVQWIVSLCFLPETRNQPLVERIIEEENGPEFNDHTNLAMEGGTDLEKSPEKPKIRIEMC